MEPQQIDLGLIQNLIGSQALTILMLQQKVAELEAQLNAKSSMPVAVLNGASTGPGQPSETGTVVSG
jgi:hypothetical protein